MEDDRNDIDWQLRYGEHETPEVAEFLGYDEEGEIDDEIHSPEQRRKP